MFTRTATSRNGVWKVQEITFLNQIGGRYGDSLRPTVEGPLDAPSLAFHYEPSQVGEVAAIAAAAPAGVEQPASLDTLAARLAALEPVVAQLTAENAVLNLQNVYGFYADRKLWDDVADLFSDDGTLEIGNSGVYVGPASIRRGLDQFGPAYLRGGEINDYVLMQPIVSVAADGGSAKARGVYLGMTGRVGAGAEWREGLYENEYVHDDGVWKIKTLRAYPRLVTDYDKGWALDAQPIGPPSEAFPPDRPPTSAYESYPKFVIPPFHFRHPVTGRPPQYPAAHAGGDPSTADERPAAAASVATVDELEERLGALEEALRAAAAAAAAENLLNAFAYYADEHQWDAASELFTNDAWAEVASVGVYVGQERLREALHAAYGARRAGTFELNQIAQPVVHVDSDTTRIRARLEQIVAVADGDDVYASGIYEAAIEDESGVFAISALDFTPTWAATHSRGWARVGDGEPAALVAVPPANPPPAPDRPLVGTTAPPFPAIEDVPFHYPNPVSGRPPARASF